MKGLPFFCLLFFAILLASLISCNSTSSDETVNSATTSTDNPNTTSTSSNDSTTGEIGSTEKNTTYSIDALDDNDNPVTLNYDQSDILVVLGSWCPHSSNLLKAITDSRYSQLFDKDKVIFLLDRNEIDNFKEYAASSGEFTPEEIERAEKGLDEIKEYSKIVDPRCLEKLSNYKHYYVDYKKNSLSGVPRCTSNGYFQGNYMQALADHLYAGNPTLFKSFLSYFENLEKNDQ